MHLIRLSITTRAKPFYQFKTWILNLSLQSIPSYLQYVGLENSLRDVQFLYILWWGKLKLIFQTYQFNKLLTLHPSLHVYLCTSDRAPTRPAKLEAMVLNSICLSLACSPTWEREQSLFFSIFFVSIMKSFLNRPSDTGYRWKMKLYKTTIIQTIPIL